MVSRISETGRQKDKARRRKWQPPKSRTRPPAFRRPSHASVLLQQRRAEAPHGRRNSAPSHLPGRRRSLSRRRLGQPALTVPLALTVPAYAPRPPSQRRENAVRTPFFSHLFGRDLREWRLHRKLRLEAEPLQRDMGLAAVGRGALLPCSWSTGHRPGIRCPRR